MSTLLLTTKLPIPPSVNNRTVFTAHGGYDSPVTRQYKNDAGYILMSAEETYQVREAIEQARINNDFLSITMIFYLPQANNPNRKGPYFLGRDKDNMVQLTQNAVCQRLGIDDVMVIASPTYKFPLPANAQGYVHVTVSAVTVSEIIQAVAVAQHIEREAALDEYRETA